MKAYLEGKKLNKIEKNKADKDGLLVGTEIEKFAQLGWEQVDKTDLELRLKWYGMFWRPKSPGKFMLRLRIPNGVLNAHQMNIIASIVGRYGEDGSCDITTRQNLQLRGILISDLPEILKRLKEAGLDTIQSGFDNPRNVTGNPLAGIDPEEIIDTRDFTFKLEQFLTNNGAGNSEFSNLPRKWNTAVAGSKDNFLLHNDIVFHPVRKNGVLGFGVWIGGILSSQLNEYAIPLNAWIKPEDLCLFTGIVISIWRDNGERNKRQRGRFRFFLNDLGIEKFRSMVEERFGHIENDPGSSFTNTPRSIFGIKHQKQKNLNYAGLHIPVGRLTSEDMQEIASLSSEYGNGEIRLTEDQNVIIPNIHTNKVKYFKEDKLLNRFPLNPSPISAGTVSCTGSTYCSFALTNTKDQALQISKELDEELDLQKEIKIHWTGCPNSCGQAYMGAIGLTGTKVKDKNGKISDGFSICIGGEQGPNPKVGELRYKSILKDNIKDVLKEILVDNYSASPKNQSLIRLRKTFNRLKSLIHNYRRSSQSP